MKNNLWKSVLGATLILFSGLQAFANPIQQVNSGIYTEASDERIPDRGLCIFTVVVSNGGETLSLRVEKNETFEFDADCNLKTRGEISFTLDQSQQDKTIYNSKNGDSLEYRDSNSFGNLKLNGTRWAGTMLNTGYVTCTEIYGTDGPCR